MHAASLLSLSLALHPRRPQLESRATALRPPESVERRLGARTHLRSVGRGRGEERRRPKDGDWRREAPIENIGVNDEMVSAARARMRQGTKRLPRQARQGGSSLSHHLPHRPCWGFRLHLSPSEVSLRVLIPNDGGRRKMASGLTFGGEEGDCRS